MVSATVRTNLGVFIETDRNIETSDFLKKLKQKFQHHQDIRIQINTVVKPFPAGGSPKSV
jgi:hypothetical protein